MRRSILFALLALAPTLRATAQGGCVVSERPIGDEEAVPAGLVVPELDVWRAADVEWEPARKHPNGCWALGGRLVLRDGPGRDSSARYDWRRRVWLVVARDPGATPDWSGALELATTRYHYGYVHHDGTFTLGVHAEPVADVVAAGGPLRVGLLLLPPGFRGDWDAQPRTLLPRSVADVRIEEPGPFTLERFHAEWNVRCADFSGLHAEPWSLLPLPPIRPAERAPLPPERAAELEALVDRLQDVDAPDAGYSPTMSGTRFLPWPWVRSVGALRSTNHGLGGSDALRELERAGPDALPVLLRHLDDARPTRVPLATDGGYGVTAQERGVAGNPFHERERRVLGASVVPDLWGADDGPALAGHVVTVGDLCYVALGQIVNRSSYQAVRYKPSGHCMVSSPALDPELACMLRDVWSGGDPREVVLRSLLVDFHTRGTSASELQVGAAARLALYFPDEAGFLVASRLDALDVRAPVRHRQESNRIDTVAFLAAVAHSSAAPIQDALLRVLERTDDPDVLRACFPEHGRPDDPIRGKLAWIVAALPADGLGHAGRGYDVLWTCWRLRPSACRDLFAAYLAPGTVERHASMSLFAEQLDGERPIWLDELLLPLLDDRRATGRLRAQHRGDARPSHPERVRDAAAVALARGDDGFEPFGAPAELDARIDALRERVLARLGERPGDE